MAIKEINTVASIETTAEQSRWVLSCMFSITVININISNYWFELWFELINVAMAMDVGGKMMLTLVARKACFGLPTACPSCLPVYVFLKFTGLPFVFNYNLNFPDSGTTYYYSHTYIPCFIQRQLSLLLVLNYTTYYSMLCQTKFLTSSLMIATLHLIMRMAALLTLSNNMVLLIWILDSMSSLNGFPSRLWLLPGLLMLSCMNFGWLLMELLPTTFTIQISRGPYLSFCTINKSFLQNNYLALQHKMLINERKRYSHYLFLSHQTKTLFLTIQIPRGPDLVYTGVYHYIFLSLFSL